MNRPALLLTALLALASCSSVPSPTDPAQLTVYTSFYMMTDLTEKIAGGRAEVICLAPAGVDPHDWEPSVRDMERLVRADMLVVNGGVEGWVDKLAETARRENPDFLLVTAGDSLPGVADDPHTWLDPAEIPAELRNIADGLCAVDPAHREDYRRNEADWSAQYADLADRYRPLFAACENKQLVVTHGAFGRLCQSFGLTQMSLDGGNPDSEPSPARLAEVIDLVRRDRIPTVFYAANESRKVADAIARETGCGVDSLETLEVAPQTGDSLQALENNLAKIREALQ